MKKQIALAVFASVCTTGLALAQNNTATNNNKPAGTQKVAADFSGTPQQLPPVLCANENHKVFEQFVGQWDAKVTIFQNGATESFNGIQTNTLGLGGRFLNTAFRGNFGGEFVGSGTMGYNNVTKQYESTWIDSMSTWITFENNGTYDSSTKTLTLKGQCTDPNTNQKKSTRTVYTVNSTSQYTCTSFETVNGTETKTMEIVYTRKALAQNNANSTNKYSRTIMNANPNPIFLSSAAPTKSE